VILILGVANLIGDGFSMAASHYSATRTEREELESLSRREERHIDEFPDGEREEVRQIFAGIETLLIGSAAAALAYAAAVVLRNVV